MRDGWVEATLGDLISYSIGGIWGEDPGNSEVDVPVYRQTEFNNSGILTTPADAYRSITRSQLKSRALQYGDILIQKSAGTPTLPGRVVMVPKLKNEVATFSNFLNLLRPDETKCIPRFAFLCFWFKHHIGRAYEFQRGTNIKNLDLPNYLEETIFLPSLMQQKRIVDLVSSVDSYIETLQGQLQSVKRSRNAVLHQLLSVGGDDWETTTIGEISDFVSARKSPEQLPSDSVYVGLEHLEPNNTSIDNFDSISKVTSSLTPFDVGDVLFGRLRPYLHKVVIAEMFGFCSPEILVLRANSKVLPQMLLLFCDADSTIKICVERSAGTRMPRTSTEDLASIEIKLPPMAEQIKLAELFSTFDTEISKLGIALEKSKILRSGLLSDLLSGEHEISASYDKVIGAA